MELKDYLGIISKRLLSFVSIFLLVTILTFVFSLRIPLTYDSSASVNVTIKNSSLAQNAYYDYDGYYNFQGSSLFADTIYNWLQDPSTVIDIYSNAGIDIRSMKLKNIVKQIKSTKKQPATIILTVNNADKIKAETVISQTIKYLTSKTIDWNNQGLTKNIDLVSTSPVVIDHKPELALNTGLGAIAGLIISLGLVFLLEYLHPKYKK